MRELVILGSSSIITPQNSNHYHHRHVITHSKPKPRPSTLSSSTTTAVNSRSPLRFDLSSRHSSLLSYYADLASKLAEDARLHDFSLIAESLVASGVDTSQFVAALRLQAVSVGISKCLREGNVKSVVEVLRKFDSIGISASELLDAVSVDFIKDECRRIVDSEEVEDIVDFMQFLAGFCFSVKELVEPSKIIALCVKKRKPKVAVRYAATFPDERILFCTIVNEFGKKRDFDSALTAYEASKPHLHAPNMYLYRTIIDVCGLCGKYKKSREIYEELVDEKVIPNIYVFNSLMNVNANDLSYTLQLHKDMQNLGVPADVASYNILLKACCRAGRVNLAQQIYKEMKQKESRGLLKLDDFTYCTIVKVFADAKLWQMALKIKNDMLSAGVTPNTFTWSSLISACANAGLVEQAIQLFEEMLVAGCKPNSQCCNILLHACVEACQYDRAFRLFQSWKGDEAQVQMQNPEPSPSHLVFLKKIPFLPTSTTYNILMKACGSDYLRAKTIIDEMKSAGISPNQISWSILMDICGSSGNVEGVIQILKNMHMTGVEPDVVAYTTAIKVCVENKNLKLAFSLFSEMKGYQIKPNLVTYNTILRARTRYGSLEEVQQCLAVYQDMRKAGYKSNDYYLKQLIEEWCEGVIQENNESRENFAVSYKSSLRRLHGLDLEKVATHLQNNNKDVLAIDVRGLTKVEARIMVLAVLRMVKENFIAGELVKDDMRITVGINKANLYSTKQASNVISAILELLQSELGLEVQTAEARNGSKLELESLSHPGCGSVDFRRPTVMETLKVTRKSMNDWLQRRAQTVGNL